MWRCVHRLPWTKRLVLMMPAPGSVGSSTDNETHSTDRQRQTITVTQRQINRLQNNYTGSDQTLHRQESLVYQRLTLQWECVSKPTSSPLAIIFLCVSASVRTAPFTPNNWKSAAALAGSTDSPVTNTCTKQEDVMPLNRTDILGNVRLLCIEWL